MIIKIEKRYAYIIIGLLVLAIGVFIVNAYGTSTPSVFGHSAGEIDLSEGVNGNAIFNDKVGIGTTSPEQKLHVESNVLNGWVARLDNIATSKSHGLRIEIAPATSNDQILSLISGGVHKMFVRGDGNVGIGTTSPASTLEVDGTIHSTSGGIKFPDNTVQTTAGGICRFCKSCGGNYPINSGEIATQGVWSGLNDGCSGSWVNVYSPRVFLCCSI